MVGNRTSNINTNFCKSVILFLQLCQNIKAQNSAKEEKMKAGKRCSLLPSLKYRYIHKTTPRLKYAKPAKPM
jgi:hypothetical protein